MSLSSLLATGTSLLVRVREISVLLSWEITCSALLSPRLATLSPARAQRALLAVLASRGLASRAQSNPAQTSCKESVPTSTLLPPGRVVGPRVQPTNQGLDCRKLIKIRQELVQGVTVV